jgi:hypothetical protein
MPRFNRIWPRATRGLRFPFPVSRFPLLISRFPIPDSRFPIPEDRSGRHRRPATGWCDAALTPPHSLA